MANYNSTLQSNNVDLQEILNTINELPNAGGSGIELPSLTNEGTASDLLSGKQLIDSDGNIITGNIPTVPRAVPSIDIDYDIGTIAAYTHQAAGYVTAGSQTCYEQLPTQAALTIIPTKSAQTAVPSGVFTTGVVTVLAIPDEYITTTDATASASEIMNGETAYVNGNKVTGTFSIDSELSTQDDLIAQIQAAVDSLPEAGGSSGGSGSGTSIGTCMVSVTTDESASILGVRMDNGVPVPIYLEESGAGLTWEAPCGSIVAVAYPFGDNNNCINATYLGNDNGIYATNDIMGYLHPIHLFRIDANAGETASIEMYEFL